MSWDGVVVLAPTVMAFHFGSARFFVVFCSDSCVLCVCILLCPVSCFAFFSGSVRLDVGRPAGVRFSLPSVVQKTCQN